MSILPLLNRDWYEFRKDLVIYLVIWISIPVLIHLLVSIPLSHFISLEVRYLNWAAAGIWVTSASMASFLETSMRIHKITFESRQIEVLLQSPISNLDFMMVLLLRGVVFGFIQFIFSILITCALNHEYLGVLSVLVIIIHIMACILFFSAFGILMGLIVSNRVIFIQLSLTLFIMISMGMGAFIPINSFPASYLAIAEKLPLTIIVQNLQSIIIHQSVEWSSLFITLILTILMFCTTLMISNRFFRNI